MSDEMEIMREWEEMWKRGRGDSKRLADYANEMRRFLPDAVRREIVRVLKDANRELKSQGIEDSTMEKHIAKYSPSPRYCEGMQEAMSKHGNGPLVRIKKIRIKKNGIYQINLLGKIDMAWDWRDIYRCPFCKDGKNCIGTHKKTEINIDEDIV